MPGIKKTQTISVVKKTTPELYISSFCKTTTFQFINHTVFHTLKIQDLMRVGEARSVNLNHGSI